MTITYPLAWPSSLTVNNLKYIPRVASAKTQSNFSFSTKVVNYSGQIWELEGSLPLMVQNDAEDFITFAMSLRGGFGTFLFPIPDGIAPRKAISGTPLVNGGSQTGSTLSIDGLANSVTDAIPAGTWLNIGTGSGTQTYKTLTSSDTNASGEATLDVWPDLRSSPADNAAIRFDNVTMLCRLNGAFQYDLDVNKHYFLPFSAMEAI